MTSEIKYYRINANNTQLATSNTGTGNGDAPTEEITAPTVGGTIASASSVTVTAQAATLNALSVGQYLYRIQNSTGNYILMGQISAIANDSLTLTLTAAFTGGAPTAGETLAGSYSLITTTESIYLRISTETSGTSIVIPNFRQWRQSADNVAGLNNPNIIALDQISSVGTPISPLVSVVPVPFTIQTMNVFVYGTTNSITRAWPNSTQYPQYMWIRVTPANTTKSLASKTLYRWTTQEAFDGITYGAGAQGPTIQQLQNAGYNVTTGAASGPPAGS